MAVISVKAMVIKQMPWSLNEPTVCYSMVLLKPDMLIFGKTCKSQSHDYGMSEIAINLVMLPNT